MAQCPISAETRVEKFVVEKSNGMKLSGLLHETGSAGVDVLCHGYRSSKDGRTIVPIARALEKENRSVCLFDFTGNGESEGEFDYSNHWGEVEDIHAIVQYLTKRGLKISSIIGHSKGGNVVLLYASKYGDVPAVVNLSGRFNLESGMEKTFGIGFMEALSRDGYIDVKKKKHGKVEYRVMSQSIKDRLAINMEESCSRIHKECRVLTVHGSKDEITPVEDAHLFHKTIPNHTTSIIEGANHCYTSHKVELSSAILSFIKNV